MMVESTPLDREASWGAVDAAAVYQTIRANPAPLACNDPFAAHIFACAISIGVVEAIDLGVSVSTAIGLDKSALSALIRDWLPEARRFIAPGEQPETVALDEEETQLRGLLDRYRRDASLVTEWIVAIVARRSMAPRHLWQDLGLFNRGELSQLVARWFPQLAADNVDNMKWKKFFYRKLCELEGFTLCAAPTCRECGDFDACFGEESGQSALARLAHAPRD